jgi:hypothetical protein
VTRIDSEGGSQPCDARTQDQNVCEVMRHITGIESDKISTRGDGKCHEFRSKSRRKSFEHGSSLSNRGMIGQGSGESHD